MKQRLRLRKLSEVSLVDRGDNPGATVSIHKRAPDAADEPYWKRDFSDAERQTAANSGAALPDGSFPIQNATDLENAVKAIGRAKDPAKAKAHIVARAKALGCTDKLPDGWVSKRSAWGERFLSAFGAALGWTDEQYAKAAARMEPEDPTGDDLPEEDPGSAPDGDDDDKPGKPGKGKGKKQQPTSKHEDPMPENTAVADVTKAELEALTKRVEKAEAEAKAAADEKAELRKAFDAEVEKRELGEYIRKAEALRAIPGEPEAVAKMLLAVDKQLPADVAKQVRESFAALNRLAVEGGLLESVGKAGSTEAPSGSAATEFMRLVNERVSKSKESMADAMRAVSKENPALYDRYLTERAG